MLKASSVLLSGPVVINIPEQEVSEPVEAALRHSGAQTPVDGGRALQINLQPLRQKEITLLKSSQLKASESHNRK